MQALFSAYAYSNAPIGFYCSQGTSPFELFALLLFRAPDVFTLRSLYAFDGLVDANHQFLAEL